MDINFYKDSIEKQAGLLPAIAKGVKAVASTSTAKKALTGAALGAGVKGLTYKPSVGKESSVGGRLGAMAGGALTGGLLGSSITNSNISSAGKTLASAGDKVFNGAAKNMLGSGKVNTALSNAGIGMNDYGTKIQNYFGK